MMQFPTMVSLQGALPNLPAASDLVQTSSFGTQSQGLTAPQSPSYTSAMSPFSPSLTSAMPTGKFTQIFFFPLTSLLSLVLVMSNLIISGANMGLQVHNNMTPFR